MAENLTLIPEVKIPELKPEELARLAKGDPQKHPKDFSASTEDTEDSKFIPENMSTAELLYEKGGIALSDEEKKELRLRNQIGGDALLAMRDCARQMIKSHEELHDAMKLRRAEMDAEKEAESRGVLNFLFKAAKQKTAGRAPANDDDQLTMR